MSNPVGSATRIAGAVLTASSFAAAAGAVHGGLLVEREAERERHIRGDELLGRQQHGGASALHVARPSSVHDAVDDLSLLVLPPGPERDGVQMPGEQHSTGPVLRDYGWPVLVTVEPGLQPEPVQPRRDEVHDRPRGVFGRALREHQVREKGFRLVLQGLTSSSGPPRAVPRP